MLGKGKPGAGSYAGDGALQLLARGRDQGRDQRSGIAHFVMSSLRSLWLKCRLALENPLLCQNRVQCLSWIATAAAAAAATGSCWGPTVCTQTSP